MITIVSGLPRSGTSLMMQILEANGFEILTDNERKADENNIKGYYEYEKVKSLMKDNGWLGEAEGKAVKIIAQLIPYLPNDFEYKIIFMERNIEEILASQTKMLERLGSNKQIPKELLEKTFKQQIDKSKQFINNSNNMDFIEVQFAELFALPESQVEAIKNNLGIELSVEKLKKVIKPELYREKGEKS